MNDVYFIIDGPVIPKGRPRFTRVGKAYTPKRTHDYEKKVKDAYLSEYPSGMAFETEPLEMILNVYMAVPKSFSKKKRDHMICFEYPTLHKGDADNFLKSVADALNGVAYTDDCQIVTATVNKIWSETDRAEVTLREVKK
jgi:Holliday junction resolvase RusA-like endonuclease